MSRGGPGIWNLMQKILIFLVFYHMLSHDAIYFLDSSDPWAVDRGFSSRPAATSSFAPTAATADARPLQELSVFLLSFRTCVCICICILQIHVYIIYI